MSDEINTREMMAAGQRAFRLKLAAGQRESVERLMAAYQDVLALIENELARTVASARDNTPGQMSLGMYDEYTALREALREALDDFAMLIEREARLMQRDGLAQAGGLAESGMKAAGIVGAFNVPSVKKLEELAGIVDGAAFQAKMEGFGQGYADHIGNVLMTNASLGKSSRATAEQIARFVRSMPLADALREVRTVQLYSARRGTSQIYQANKDVVLGWVWSSALDLRCCVSCIAMHGTVHPVEETLNDHYSGRCAMIPKTIIERSFRMGEDWLVGLNESDQIKVLGGARFRAWQDGAITLGQMSAIYYDPVYGPMRYAPSLKEMIGSVAASEYYG